MTYKLQPKNRFEMQSYDQATCDINQLLLSSDIPEQVLTPCHVKNRKVLMFPK